MTNFNGYNQLEITKELVKKNKIVINTTLGLKLILKKGVFIPHLPTFQLINIANKIISDFKDIKTVADIGTGSGLVGLSIAKKNPDIKVYLYDKSKKAIKLSQINAKENKIKNIFINQNNKNEWIKKNSVKKIDLIVSNPPFTGNEELKSKSFIINYPDILSQPKSSIRTYDKFGTAPYIAILRQAKKYGTKYFLFECNEKYYDMLVKKINTKEYKYISYKYKSKRKYLFLEKIDS